MEKGKVSVAVTNVGKGNTETTAVMAAKATMTGTTTAAEMISVASALTVTIWRNRTETSKNSSTSSRIKCEINPGNIRIDVDHKMTHYATMAMDPNFLVPSNLLIYCDAIEPSSIGNTFGSYLTNISIRKDITNQMITVEPKNLEYHTVTTGDLGNVRFQLFKTDGTPPNFKNKKHQKIFMSFIFRRRNEN